MVPSGPPPHRHKEGGQESTAGEKVLMADAAELKSMDVWY